MDIKEAVRYYHAGQLKKAQDICQKICETYPDHPDALHLSGVVAAHAGEHGRAMDLMKRAIQRSPDNPAYHSNLGSVFQGIGRLEEAQSCCRKAIQLKPDFAGAYNNMGAVFQDQGRMDEAISSFRKVLELEPDFVGIHDNLAFLLQQNCAWGELEELSPTLGRLTQNALDKGEKSPESPFSSLMRTSDPARNLAVATSWAEDVARRMSGLEIKRGDFTRRPESPKIRIGYLSSDFYDHATAHLILGVFGHHDRDEFDIFCYTYGKDDGSHYRRKIKQDCDRFVELRGLSHLDAAKRISEDGTDILVDLKGHMKDNRLEICALRPAPVQVTYLGFPGTTGADFFGYMMTDPIVTPKNHAPWYSEHLVFMPHCYQVNDHTQPISDREWRRSDFGLPEKAFVFCSFNNFYKIEPVLFDVWMKMLHRVPESVLWLLPGNSLATENLTREAAARGMDPARLVFAKGLPKAEHLARHRFADLVLDTRIYNGHTSTSDALWAGVPLLALQGTHFASRVSSSILTAIGLPELITDTPDAYENLAVRWATHPEELQAIRRKLHENRLTEPLFDTPRFVRNLEKAYQKMWETFLAGGKPRQIEVDEETRSRS